jgi:hypothetical protein
MSELSPVAVDLLTLSLRFSGVSTDPDQFRRLSDILNSPEGDLILSRVMIRNLLGVTLDQSPSVIVQKRDVLLVVPRESSEQLAQRRQQRLGINVPSLTPVPVLAVVPPYLARGVLHLRSARDFYRGASGLSQFFPLLDASLKLDGSLVERSSVILVNRDAVVALGIQDEAALQAKPQEAPDSPFRPGSTLAAQLQGSISPPPRPASPPS